MTGLDISSVAGQAAILNFKTHEFRKVQHSYKYQYSKIFNSGNLSLLKVTDKHVNFRITLRKITIIFVPSIIYWRFIVDACSFLFHLQLSIIIPSIHPLIVIYFRVKYTLPIY